MALGLSTIASLIAAPVAGGAGQRMVITASYPPTAYGLNAISRGSALACVAVGQTTADIVATTDGGSTWTTELAPAGAFDFFGVSCPSATACVAVGSNNNGTAAVSGRSPTAPIS